jgi:hypothetical protein
VNRRTYRANIYHSRDVAWGDPLGHVAGATLGEVERALLLHGFSHFERWDEGTIRHVNGGWAADPLKACIVGTASGPDGEAAELMSPPHVLYPERDGTRDALVVKLGRPDAPACVLVWPNGEAATTLHKNMQAATDHLRAAHGRGTVRLRASRAAPATPVATITEGKP